MTEHGYLEQEIERSRRRLLGSTTAASGNAGAALAVAWVARHPAWAVAAACAAATLLARCALPRVPVARLAGSVVHGAGKILVSAFQRSLGT